MEYLSEILNQKFYHLKEEKFENNFCEIYLIEFRNLNKLEFNGLDKTPYFVASGSVRRQ